MLFALMMVCKIFALPSGFSNLGISLTYLFSSIIGLIYGPIAGLTIGFFSDFLGYFLFDKSGQAFLSCLSRNPKSLEELSIEISRFFIDVKPEEIINDVKEFFDVLVEDG